MNTLRSSGMPISSKNFEFMISCLSKIHDDIDLPSVLPERKYVGVNMLGIVPDMNEFTIQIPTTVLCEFYSILVVALRVWTLQTDLMEKEPYTLDELIEKIESSDSINELGLLMEDQYVDGEEFSAMISSELELMLRSGTVSLTVQLTKQTLNHLILSTYESSVTYDL